VFENKGEIIFQTTNDVPFANKKVNKTDLKPDFEHANVNSYFYQKKVVFTGDLKSFTRQEAAHLLKELGADVNTSISRKTDFVIVGSNPGPSKMKKIEALEILIISEEEFVGMISQ